MSRITRRIGGEHGIPRPLEVLGRDMPASDLQSLLLSVYQERAEALRESWWLRRRNVRRCSSHRQ